MTSFGDWFSFDGRIARRDYWLFYALLPGLVQLVVSAIGLVARLGHVDTPAVNNVLLAIEILWAILGSLGGLAGATKRLHDRDRSGWFQLIVLLPIIGALWLTIELGLLRGTFGTNRYGPDPLAGRRY